MEAPREALIMLDLREFTFRDYSKEWFNKEILDLIYQRRAAVLEYQNTGDPALFELVPPVLGKYGIALLDAGTNV